MHMIGHQMAFFDPRFLLRRQLVEHLAEALAELEVQRLLRHFGMNTTWNLQSQVVWLKA